LFIFYEFVVLGENSTPPISNPPTPVNDFKKSLTKTNLMAASKLDGFLNESSNAKSGNENGNMNIKNFFRVSKTTPSFPQKVVVHMLEKLPSNNNSVRSSLRSSARKTPNFDQNKKKIDTQDDDDDKQQSTIAKNDDTIEQLEIPPPPKQTVDDEKPITESNLKIDLSLAASTSNSTTTPLTIITPEKLNSSLQLSSPPNPILTSPNSNVPKKKKKLNDCIAMLTCKIQEKLGVSFFDSLSSKQTQLEETKPQDIENDEACEQSSALPTVVEDNKFTIPIQEEVIDLSVKKKATETAIAMPDLPAVIENKPEPNDIDMLANEPQLLECLDGQKQNEHEISEIIAEKVVVVAAAKEAEKFPIDEKESDDKETIFKDADECEVSKITNDQEAAPVSDNNNESSTQSIEKAVEKVADKKSLVKTAKVVKKKVATSVPQRTKKTLAKLNKKNIEEVATPSLIEEKDTEALCKKEDDEKAPIIEQLPPKIFPIEESLISDESIAIIEESFKISIAKDKIPNLNDILQQYQVITVNNIKISESERRAFEEQKNRILQILSKNSLTRKVTTKKTKSKIAKKRSPAKKRVVKKETHLKEGKPIIAVDVEKDKEKEETAKIEAVIKTTNRIRCRRLSVVVDPIINLSAFQNKNRKIRLTNNSQQNGFYDLLTASSEIFTSKSPEPCKTDPVSSESKLLKANEVTPTKANAAAAEDLKSVTNKALETRSSNTPASKEESNDLNADRSIKSETLLAKERLSRAAKTRNSNKLISDKVEESEVIENAIIQPEKPVNQQKSRSRRQNVENIIPKEKELPPTIEDIIKEVNIVEPKVAQKKAATKAKKNEYESANLISTEEVKQQIDIEPNKPEVMMEASEVNGDAKHNFDASFSSDTSNENDIPLAKLAAADSKKESAKASRAKLNRANRKDNKKTAVDATSESSELLAIGVEQPKAEEIVKVLDEIVAKEEKEEVIKDVLREANLKTDCDTNQIPDARKSEAIEAPRSVESFNINEDAFFNDDLENENSDKLNDIVNNIINSSELLIDSDTETKSETDNVKPSSKAKPVKKSFDCKTCSKTFKNNSGLERHNKTNTHILKERKHEDVEAKQIEKEATIPYVIPPPLSSPISDETKVFRTKGALKTFDSNFELPPSILKKSIEVQHEVIKTPEIESKSEVFLKREDIKDPDIIFDSLFAKLQDQSRAPSPPPPTIVSKVKSPVITPEDSEIESSSTSWDLKNDAEIEWEGDCDNVPFANAIKERYPKKIPVKINKLKETAVSIPTKSLIMGKIFKKHRDSEKQKTPQADAPNNKQNIKNSLDEIFDHLKNSAEIDDKVLTCPSPKTLLKASGGTFSPQSSNSNDMLETASHTNNNNIYVKKVQSPLRVDPVKPEKRMTPKPVVVKQAIEVLDEVDDDGTGTRKSRRRCVIKAKTFAETWSSDEYEELHDHADIMSMINELERRESNKKKKLLRAENQLEMARQFEAALNEKKSIQMQLVNSRKRRLSAAKDGHKSDDETITVTNNTKPEKAAWLKKRRMSCFVPSSAFDEPKLMKESPFVNAAKDKEPNIKIVKEPKAAKEPVKFVKEPSLPKVIKESTKLVKEPSIPRSVKEQSLPRFESTKLPKKHEKPLEYIDIRSAAVRKSDSEKSLKLHHHKNANFSSNSSQQSAPKKKAQKHRKRSKNKVKNIAYDSDSDFELNLNRKSKTQTTLSESEEEDDEDEIKTPIKPIKSQQLIASKSDDMTISREPKLLPNDLKEVTPAVMTTMTTTTTTYKAAIPEDITDPSTISACNRTKRQSSDKLYYWSSSSSESDVEDQADTADGDNEDSIMPQQPEQHGWIVGDSHKKLVTLLAHAKIKNKIN